MERIKERLPLPLLGIDSDNDGAFINAHLIRYFEENKLTFTRSRPYKKNDNCYVEQRTTRWFYVWRGISGTIPKRRRSF
jgi:hypothetical protein